MSNHQKQQIIEAERQYLGKQCWKTSGHKTIHTGVIRQIRLEGNWVEGQVFWQTRNGEDLDGHPNNWEKVANLGFESLPSFGGRSLNRDRGEETAAYPRKDLTPWSTPADSLEAEDCQGLPEEEEDRITKTASQITEVLPHIKAPKRRDQSAEANRAVNYRALLALIDKRQRDITHLLHLNETLKREGCNTITLPAFKMRADKFQKSFERSIRQGNFYTFLREAFNGEWHGDIDKTSIWSRF